MLNTNLLISSTHLLPFSTEKTSEFTWRRRERGANKGETRKKKVVELRKVGCMRFETVANDYSKVAVDMNDMLRVFEYHIDAIEMQEEASDLCCSLFSIPSQDYPPTAITTPPMTTHRMKHLDFQFSPSLWHLDWRTCRQKDHALERLGPSWPW